MHILITGASGMIGRKLTERLLSEPELGGREVAKLTLADVEPPDFAEPNAETSIMAVAGDISDPLVVERLVAEKPDLVFHLAAVVSGEAEADFDKGCAVNLEGTRLLLAALRVAHYSPRVVFASSIAVFGAPFPDPIPDDFAAMPLTSYGTQKAMGELLLNDYVRRGFFDGVSLRLPTICVRPGKANRAASGFFSGIIREPLKGEEAVLPVEDDVRHWHASPRAAIGFFLHAATMDLNEIGPRRALTMPGVSVTVAEQIEALRSVAGEKAAALIRREPDETIARIVSGWPQAFEARRARDLGFTADESFEALVRAHIEDEHGGRAPIMG